VEFGYRGIRGRVKSPARPDKDAILLGEAKVLAGDSVRTEIARAKDAGRFGQFRNSDYGFGDGHYTSGIAYKSRHRMARLYMCAA
jgi:hypothetical protein